MVCFSQPGSTVHKHQTISLEMGKKMSEFSYGSNNEMIIVGDASDLQSVDEFSDSDDVPWSDDSDSGAEEEEDQQKKTRYTRDALSDYSGE